MPVHDLYGATEAGCIAWRCPACEAYHVNSDTALVEVLNDGEPAQLGEIGAVVITNLFARTMPFIRYQLGELAELGPSCPEAPGCVTLRSLRGRTTDRLIGSDGRMLSPYTFVPDEIEGIARYRVIQERPDLVRVLVVPGGASRPMLSSAPAASTSSAWEHDAGSNSSCASRWRSRSPVTARHPDSARSSRERAPLHRDGVSGRAAGARLCCGPRRSRHERGASSGRSPLGVLGRERSPAGAPFGSAGVPLAAS